MKSKLIILSAAVLLSACAQDLQTRYSSGSGAEVIVTAPLRPLNMQAATRGVDETSVNDLNFYLYDSFSQELVLHEYHSRAKELNFSCVPGNYEIFLLANTNGDLGEMSYAQVREYTVWYSVGMSSMPMAYYQALKLRQPAEGNQITLPALELRRCHAKIAYNVMIDPALSDMRLISLEAFNVPRYGTVFGDSTPSASADDYVRSMLHYTYEGADTYEGVLYLPQNCQGMVAAITDQRQKNRDNAPRYATYLMIRATRGDKVLDYVIYPGQNSTSDFNVRSNTVHTLDITLMGDSEVDTRVHGYTVAVYDDYELFGLSGYCIPKRTFQLHIDVEGNTDQKKLRATVELLTGDAAHFYIKYMETGSKFSFDIANLLGANAIFANYTLPLATQAKGRLKYKVTISDEYGYFRSYIIEHLIGNEIEIPPSDRYFVTVTGSPYYLRQPDGTLRVVCYENGCTFRVSARDASTFEGWYSDPEHTRRVSTTNPYTPKPTSVYTKLYPYFKPVKVKF